jgi:hypothetical protein
VRQGERPSSPPLILDRVTDSLTEALAATIAATRSAERDLFGGLDDATRERPIRAGDWNPKDFQAHLTAWKDRQANRYVAVREGRDLPPSLQGEEEDQLNAELRASRINWMWEDIVQEAEEVAGRLMTEIRTADPNVLLGSDRLIGGTFGNGVLHALTHFRWLLEAGVPLDPARVDRFASEALDLVRSSALPERAQAVAFYDLACFHALRGSVEVAKDLLRDAFRMDPELVEFSRTDPDLASIRSELAELAGSSAR